MLTLSKAQARCIILNAAGLASTAQFGQGRAAVYLMIEHFGFLQLDTNTVIKRAHHHVLATRIPDYRSGWLDELVEEGCVFEYFASDSAYLPMKDFRFTLPVKQAFETGRKSVT